MDMVPGIGGGEFVVIALVALIVIGPKDLPKMLRQLGRFVAKMRSMADEFRASFDDMARQSELDDLRKEVESLRSGKSFSPIVDDINDTMNRIEGDIKSVGTMPVAEPMATIADIPAAGVDETIAPVKPKRARKKKVESQT
jgi:Tat protein translocase TatB subunit